MNLRPILKTIITFRTRRLYNRRQSFEKLLNLHFTPVKGCLLRKIVCLPIFRTLFGASFFIKITIMQQWQNDNDWVLTICFLDKNTRLGISSRCVMLRVLCALCGHLPMFIWLIQLQALWGAKSLPFLAVSIIQAYRW